MIVVLVILFLLLGATPVDAVRGECEFNLAERVRIRDHSTLHHTEITERGFILAPELWDIQTGAMEYTDENRDYFYNLERRFVATFLSGDEIRMKVVGLIEVRYTESSAWVLIQDQHSYEPEVGTYDPEPCAFIQVPYYSNAAPLVWFNEIYNRDNGY